MDSLRTLLAGPALVVAPALLNASLVSTVDDKRVSLRITEVEAYSGHSDPGSHGYRGMTARNAVMFGAPGLAYVYFTYGMHWCLNVVCESEGTCAAVLLRAGEILEGEAVARARRPAHRVVSPVKLASGPARLTSCLAVTGALNGTDLLQQSSALRLAPAITPVAPAMVSVGPRVGVGGAGASTPWRWWITDDPTVSTYRAHVRRARR